MPYGISQNQSDCSGWAAVKENADGTYETIGCHDNKQDAIDQMVAASISDGIDPLGEVGARSADGSVGDTMDTETRELPPSYRPADSADVPVMRPSCSSCEYFCEMVDLDGALQRSCSRWLSVVEPDAYCDAYEPKEAEAEVESESGGEMEMDAARSVEWLTIQENERRHVAYSNLEVRAEGDSGNTLVGYAAMFDLSLIHI